MSTTKGGKLWRIMVTHAQKRHDTYRQVERKRECYRFERIYFTSLSTSWSNIAFEDAFCTESYYVAENKSNQRDGKKMQSKLTFTGARSKERKIMLTIELVGVSKSTKTANFEEIRCQKFIAQENCIIGQH